MRVPLSTASRFAVTALPYDGSRELHTVEADAAVWNAAEWLAEGEKLSDAEWFVGDITGAIYRVIPPSDATDEMIAAVRAELERRGAHVRMLPREKGQASSVEVPHETSSVETIRETVAYVMANLVKSANPSALKAVVEKAMTGVGL